MPLAFLEAIILQANLNVDDSEVDIELTFELTRKGNFRDARIKLCSI